MPFSVVVIARNESKTLPRLVGSLAEFQKRGGEIVVVDTGSTDNTPKIARDLGCTVFEEGTRFITTIDSVLAAQINNKFVANHEPLIVKAGEVLFDYSAARNYAASKASNDVIAMPDCDEIFTKLDIDAIDEAIKNGVGRFEYNFVFSHDQYGAELVKFLHSKFYDRTKLHWVGIIHEVLAGDCKIQRFGEDKIKLEHWQNPETNRGGYLRGLALDCFLHPDNDRNSHYFARELFWSGRNHSAIKEFQHHISLNAWPAEAAQSMIFVGDAYIALGQEDEGISWYHKAFAKDSGRRESLIRLATHYWKKNDHQRAAAYAMASLTVAWNNYYGNNAADYAQIPHEILYWALWYLGDVEGARAHWKKAIAYQPNNPKYKHDAQFFEVSSSTTPVPEMKERRPESVKHLENLIIEGKPFTFVKRGDGEEICMSGASGGNCDGHPYSAALAEKLKKAFDFFNAQENVFITIQDKDLKKVASNDVNMLLHRIDSDLPALKSFFGTIRAQSRRKVYIGPQRMGMLAYMLKAEFIPVPLVNAFEKYDEILEKLKGKLQDGGIYMFSASMPAKSLIADALKINPTITCIDLGSSFDPLFVGETRSHQASKEELEKLYAEYLERPMVSVVIPTLGREEMLAKCIHMIEENAKEYGNYEIIVEHDQFPPNNIGVPNLLKLGVENSKGSLIMFLGNDCEPQPGFMREAVTAMMIHYPKLDGLVCFNDKYCFGALATHWLGGKALLPLLDGEFFHTGYHHVGCDNELTMRTQAAGKFFWCEDAYVYHNHPMNNHKGPILDEDVANTDEVYRIGWNAKNREEDRALLAKRTKEGFKCQTKSQSYSQHAEG